jgi:hypothetical protein
MTLQFWRTVRQTAMRGCRRPDTPISLDAVPPDLRELPTGQ